jgi:hypothetical protein
VEIQIHTRKHHTRQGELSASLPGRFNPWRKSSVCFLRSRVAFSVSLYALEEVQGVPLVTEPGFSLMSFQQRFLEEFGGRHPPSKSSIWALSKKLETKGTLLDEHTGGRPKMNVGFGSEWDTLY